jgi:hypothetical protein
MICIAAWPRSAAPEIATEGTERLNDSQPRKRLMTVFARDEKLSAAWESDAVLSFRVEVRLPQLPLELT